jgi:protein-tyrosine phosphatase
MVDLDRSAAEASETRGVFGILVVCTGNICRSPQAERLLAAQLPSALRADASALRVSSAGTGAVEGARMDPLAAREAMRMGVRDTGAHVARQLRRSHVAEADLILGMTRQHRGAALRLQPNASRRAFTLVELARIVEALAGGELRRSVEPIGEGGLAPFLRRVIEHAAVVRGLMPQPDEPAELDIEDPYRRGPDAYRRSADAVDDRVARLLAGLEALAAGRPASSRQSEAH